MSNPTQQIVAKAWNFAHVLRDEGLSYMAYTEQITFLLFLKMADEQTKAPYHRKALVPKGKDWPSLLAKDGDELEAHYRHILEDLSTHPGMLGRTRTDVRASVLKPWLTWAPIANEAGGCFPPPDPRPREAFDHRRFLKECHSAARERLVAQWIVRVGGDEDDGDMLAIGNQLLLQSQSAQPRQVDVENEACRRRLLGGF